ncbi:PrsW family intramembrane metalloprotease [Nonomuraea sp. FMUSA5-5]|uniref:PrsW family intramembrane metalloprotease n=1 Tax=Nonomuraea composti TaxID=2720023 RepID=A0ABX1B8S3_9ACTN|nr:PrsW family glutamic-type intramembrane protease [Nonomuraea sp. FMUSA5-5]NJP92802.1 PrsW family intramembrane metalloprotease [Nonomuraea sp. FMUSA5-5]
MHSRPAVSPDLPFARELTPPRSGPSWVRIFFGGLALWVATVVVTFVTGNANLVPTIILVGSFLVPVTFVTFAFRRADEVITAQRIFTAFVYGGVLGVLGASLLESALLTHMSSWGYLAIGAIEEGVKLAVLWLLARRLPWYGARDGMVLGAAVGFGFAAFESAGYAFNALFTSSGLSLLDLVETEALRAVLAPVGHGLWTALLGGVLFATAARIRPAHLGTGYPGTDYLSAGHPGTGRPRLRPSRALLGWYAVVVLLHALWDASQTVAVWLTLILTGTPSQWLAIVRLGELRGVTQTQVHLFTGMSWGLLALDGLVGLALLLARWARLGRRPSSIVVRGY